MGLSRPKLLTQMGVRSRSLASYWAAGNGGTESQAIALALVEKRAFGYSDQKTVEAAVKWLKAADRFDEGKHGTPDQLRNLLSAHDSIRVEDPYELWASRLIRDLEPEGKEWAEWVKACLHAQKAARYAQEEWVKTSTGPREVWHLHFWNPTLSGTAFDAIALSDLYDKLLANGFAKVYLMVLYDDRSADPTAGYGKNRTETTIEREPNERERFNAFLDLVQNLNCHIFSAAYGRNIGFKGDVWCFESPNSRLGLYIQVPARLPNVLLPFGNERVDFNEHLVDIIALPIRVGFEDYRELLRTRCIDDVPGRDFGLRIVKPRPDSSDLQWRSRVSK